MIWGFALVDIFRRDDIGGLSKPLWAVLIFVLPFIGTLIYLVVRPIGATNGPMLGITAGSSAAECLHTRR